MTAAVPLAQAQERPPAASQHFARDRPALVGQSIDAHGNNVCRFEDGTQKIYGNQACPPFFRKASVAESREPCAVDEVPPEFNGIWATDGALKNGVNRIEGMVLYIDPRGTCIAAFGPPPLAGPIHLEMSAAHEFDLWAVQGDERIELGRVTYDAQAQTLSFRPFDMRRNVYWSGALALRRVGDFDLAAKNELRLSKPSPR